MYVVVVNVVFFFKQKTAYEMRISDWSSDVCSSDLARGAEVLAVLDGALHQPVGGVLDALRGLRGEDLPQVAAGGLDVRQDALAEIGRASCRERVCQYV